MHLGNHAGTHHAADQLKKRYKLTLPLERLLQEIYEGRGVEQLCDVPGRRIFDVVLPEYEASHIRVVVGEELHRNRFFVVSVLPPKWTREMIVEQEEAHRKSNPQFVEACGTRNRNHWKQFLRANGDADENDLEA